MADMLVGEGESNNDEASGSPMWKFLKEEYDYKRPKRGDIRYAEVLRIDEDEIIVDIGGKTEGVVPSVDLDRMGEEAVSEIEVGDKVPVYVLRPESADGDVIVSLNMARTMEDWRRAEKLFEEGGVYEGTVSGHNKGGLLVYYGQIRGFVPASQLSGLSRRSGHEERMETLSKMEGRDLVLKVIEVDRQRRRLIFSERAASREWREKRKEELLDELQEGDVRKGAVRNLCDFGAFVDLGGADGLIHISELSWRRVKHARDVLKVGDEVEVYVLRVDRERKRIGLSLKRLQPDPWHVIEEKYDVGQIVKGVVTNIVDFGAFARIEDGIEGLIHVSELSDGDFAPRDLVKEGEALYLKVLSIDAGRQRMGLSLKQAPSREEMEGTEAWADLEEAGEGEIGPEAEWEERAAGLAEEEAALAEVEEPVAEVTEEEEVVAEAEVEEPVAEVTEEEEVVAEAEVEEPVAEVIGEEEVVAEADLEEPPAEVTEEEETLAEADVEEPVAELAEEEQVLAEADVEEPSAEVTEEEEIVAEADLEEPSAEVTEEEEIVAEAEVEEPVAELAEEEEVLAEAEVEEPVAEVAEEGAVAEVEAEEPAAVAEEEPEEVGELEEEAESALEPQSDLVEDEDESDKDDEDQDDEEEDDGDEEDDELEEDDEEDDD